MCKQLVVFNSRCTSIAWIPQGDGAFVVGHADGNLYVYEKASIQLQLKHPPLSGIIVTHE